MHLFGNNRAATLSSSLKKLGYVGYYNPVSGTNPNRGINSAKPHCRRVKPELRRITLFGVIPTVWMQIVLKQRSKKILKKKKKNLPPPDEGLAQFNKHEFTNQSCRVQAQRGVSVMPYRHAPNHDWPFHRKRGFFLCLLKLIPKNLKQICGCG